MNLERHSSTGWATVPRMTNYFRALVFFWILLLHTNIPVPVMRVTKFSTPFPWPNFLSARAAQLPSLSTQTGKCSASDIGVRRSTELHSWISFVEWSTTPSRGFTRPPVEMPTPHQAHVKKGKQHPNVLILTLKPQSNLSKTSIGSLQYRNETISN